MKQIEDEIDELADGWENAKRSLYMKNDEIANPD